DSVPVAVRVDAGDVRVVHLAGDLDPLAGGDRSPHSRSVVVVQERVHGMVWRLLLPPELRGRGSASGVDTDAVGKSIYGDLRQIRDRMALTQEAVVVSSGRNPVPVPIAH